MLKLLYDTNNLNVMYLLCRIDNFNNQNDIKINI